MSQMLCTLDERLAWEYRQLAVFLNEPYSKVREMPGDEFAMLKRLMEIDALCKSKEGLDVLKLNVRLKQTAPDVDKLRQKLGKEV